MARPSLLTVSYLACVAVAAGSLGSWDVGPMGYDGINGDGAITLVCSGCAALAIALWRVTGRRWMLAVAQLAALLSVIVAGFILYELSVDPPTTFEHQVGWGLVLTLGAASLLTVLCFVQYRQANAEEPVATPRALVLMIASVPIVLAFAAWRESTFDDIFFKPTAFPFKEDPRPFTNDTKTLSGKIFSLRNGMSVATVRSRLGRESWGLVTNWGVAGEPSLVLYYGPWELVFEEDALEGRSRNFRPQHGIDYRARFQKIRRLQKGASIESVRSALGRPDRLAIHRTAPKRVIGLEYGWWTFDFTDGRLVRRYW